MLPDNHNSISIEERIERERKKCKHIWIFLSKPIGLKICINCWTLTIVGCK